MRSERYLASASGTVRDAADRKAFFQEIATMKPEEWRQGTVDAVATASADGRRIVIKAVNYEGRRNTLLARLQGAGAPELRSQGRLGRRRAHPATPPALSAGPIQLQSERQCSERRPASAKAPARLRPDSRFQTFLIHPS